MESFLFRQQEGTKNVFLIDTLELMLLWKWIHECANLNLLELSCYNVAL